MAAAEDGGREDLLKKVQQEFLEEWKYSLSSLSGGTWVYKMEKEFTELNTEDLYNFIGYKSYLSF